MNLSKFMPQYKGDSAPTDDEETLSPFEYHQKFAPKHGPSKSRPYSNGQIRRMIQRQKATAKRKANRRHRFQWMGNQRAMAVLHAQLQVVGVLPMYDGTTKPEGQRPDVVKVLTERYGSVSEAAEVYGRILADSE